MKQKLERHSALKETGPVEMGYLRVAVECAGQCHEHRTKIGNGQRGNDKIDLRRIKWYERRAERTRGRPLEQTRMDMERKNLEDRESDNRDAWKRLCKRWLQAVYKLVKHT